MSEPINAAMKEEMEKHFGNIRQFQKFMGVSYPTAYKYLKEPLTMSGYQLAKLKGYGVDVCNILEGGEDE